MALVFLKRYQTVLCEEFERRFRGEVESSLEGLELITPREGGVKTFFAASPRIGGLVHRSYGAAATASSLHLHTYNFG